MRVDKLIKIGMVLALIVSINTLSTAQSKVLQQTAKVQTEAATSTTIDPVEDIDHKVGKKNKGKKKDKAKLKGGKKNGKGKAKKHQKGEHPGKGHAYGKYKNAEDRKMAKSKTKKFVKEDLRERKKGEINSKSRKIESGSKSETVRKSRKTIPTKGN
jgi:hypothetical protein